MGAEFCIVVKYELNQASARLDKSIVIMYKVSYEERVVIVTFCVSECELLAIPE